MISALALAAALLPDFAAMTVRWAAIGAVPPLADLMLLYPSSTPLPDWRPITLGAEGRALGLTLVTVDVPLRVATLLL